MTRSFWSRSAKALERWVRPLACLAGVSLDDADHSPPALKVQMQEIFDVVSREESRWRVEDRIQGLLGYKLKRSPPSRPNS